MATEPEWVSDVLGAAVNTIVALLVAGKYDSVARITREADFSAGQLQEIVERYPGSLIQPPRGALSDVDRQRVLGQPHMTFDVTFPLWTEDDYRPRLVLTARYWEALPRFFATRLLDLGPECA